MKKTKKRKSESTTSNIKKDITLFCLVYEGLRTEEMDISRRNEMDIKNHHQKK